ncbi:MAG: alpha/beta fold hydrolase [Rhodocyclales bacterium]|nr:alpha/beta fold hydrolase [Rhodocyclales bacterium]
MKPRIQFMAVVLLLLAVLLSPPLRAAPPVQEIGIVVMHGKGGSPGRFVNVLAEALEKEGFLVANIEMPWSARRHYDVELDAAVGEASRALDELRARGAKKLFVSGHSQGGIFALLYGARHKVDGLVAIVPGGAVDVKVYLSTLGSDVARARQMIADGRGQEKAEFADYEASRGTNPVTTTASSYLSWFDPNGAHTSRVFSQVLPGVPVLHVSATRDYPGLLRFREQNHAAIPAHPLKRMAVVDSDHLNAPAAAAPEVLRWVREVTTQ